MRPARLLRWKGSEFHFLFVPLSSSLCTSTSTRGRRHPIIFYAHGLSLHINMLLLLLLYLLHFSQPTWCYTASATLPPPRTSPADVTILEDIHKRAHIFSRSDIIGTGICDTAMQGFTCDLNNNNQYRCAGDEYSYCICAGEANGGGQDGLWLNTAWGPGCYACCKRT